MVARAPFKLGVADTASSSLSRWFVHGGVEVDIVPTVPAFDIVEVVDRLEVSA